MRSSLPCINIGVRTEVTNILCAITFHGHKNKGVAIDPICTDTGRMERMEPNLYILDGAVGSIDTP